MEAVTKGFVSRGLPNLRGHHLNSPNFAGMAEIYHTDEAPQHICWDRKYYSTFEDQLKVLTNSKTIYVGNLSFFTTEQQIHEVFSVAGPINRIIMGLNQKTKTPCGFCFVEYYRREHAAACLKFVSGMIDSVE